MQRQILVTKRQPFYIDVPSQCDKHTQWWKQPLEQCSKIQTRSLPNELSLFALHFLVLELHQHWTHTQKSEWGTYGLDLYDHRHSWWFDHRNSSKWSHITFPSVLSEDTLLHNVTINMISLLLKISFFKWRIYQKPFQTKTLSFPNPLRRPL